MSGIMNESAGMWKEVCVASLRYNPSIYMEIKKKTREGRPAFRPRFQPGNFKKRGTISIHRQ
jgi:hypothetical protein